MMVVPVLITSCHVSLKRKMGPVIIHTAITATASTKVRGRPQKCAADFANPEYHVAVRMHSAPSSLLAKLQKNSREILHLSCACCKVSHRRFLSKKYTLARYMRIDNGMKSLPADLSCRLIPGTFENEVSVQAHVSMRERILSRLDDRFRNDKCRVPDDVLHRKAAQG